MRGHPCRRAESASPDPPAAETCPQGCRRSQGGAVGGAPETCAVRLNVRPRGTWHPDPAGIERSAQDLPPRGGQGISRSKPRSGSPSARQPRWNSGSGASGGLEGPGRTWVTWVTWVEVSTGGLSQDPGMGEPAKRTYPAGSARRPAAGARLRLQGLRAERDHGDAGLLPAG